MLHPEQGQEVLERVAAAAEPGGVDAAVVGQGGGRSAMLLGRRQERGDDVVAGNWGVGGAGEQESGVIIEPVQDLDIGAVSESPMGEVGLPGLVRQCCFEAEVGRTGRFFGSGTTRPAACRMRRIVEVDGTWSPSRSRCQAIVTGPAS